MAWIILFLLPLLIGGAKLSERSRNQKLVLLEHEKEVKEIRKKFYEALKMRFLRIPIVVQTEKQEAYYKKMKVHYKNSSRKIELIPYHLGEDKTAYRNRVANFIDQWCSFRLEEIEHGKEAYHIYFEEIKAANLMRYFSSPFDTEVSKVFIYETIQFLLDHPRPEHGNYKKELVLM